MKIATWNVNGIRAREAQLCDWVERDRPDVVCLQEIKARPDQVPDRCKLADYHAFWHGAGGYSGVSLHLRRELLRSARIRASRVRHGDAHRAGGARQPRAGVGLRAQRRQGLRGEAALPAQPRRVGARAARARGASSSCAATSTSPARTSTCIPGSASPASSASATKSAPCSRRCSATTWSTSRARSIPTTTALFTLVAALARHAQAQHRLADRLHPGLADDRRARDGVPRSWPTSAPAITRRS